jgi:Flp pilus assembly protein TadG
MLLARFWKNRDGNVAPMLALSIIPLMGAVGVAFDYGHANAVKANMQAALDSTALMMSKTAATLSDQDMQAQALKIFKASFNQPDATVTSFTAAYTSSGGSKVALTGEANVPTTFIQVLKLVGLDSADNVTVKAESTSTWGNSRLRVALVLDNTGSMSQFSKMTALKTATQNLLTQFKNAAVNDGDVYVSIIPFTKDVNVDQSNFQQQWIRWDLWDAANGTCSKTKYTSQSSCTSNRGSWTPADHSTWNGCVTDRDQNFDTTNDAPVADSTLYPAEQYGVCPVSLMGLSYDWTALSNKVNAMQPNGNTNQAIGLQMGWQSLTAAPFTVPSEDPNYQYQRVIILLTDGLNTQDRWYSNASSIDARQQKTCDNIKAAGITIYTVQVNTDNDPTSTLLQSCASDSSKFFLLTSSTEIVTTFGQIGTALSNLRLSM